MHARSGRVRLLGGGNAQFSSTGEDITDPPSRLRCCRTGQPSTDRVPRSPRPYRPPVARSLLGTPAPFSRPNSWFPRPFSLKRKDGGTDGGDQAPGEPTSPRACLEEGKVCDDSGPFPLVPETIEIYYGVRTFLWMPLKKGQSYRKKKERLQILLRRPRELPNGL